MPRPTLYVSITNHGFGHATRAASVVAMVQQQLPEVDLILATTAPRWLLEGYIEGAFTYRARAFDIGVIQADSLQMDTQATLEKLQHVRAMEASWVEEESAFLREARVDLVLADIPPLAVAIAHAAGVSCWMLGNFGWDFIYRPWGKEFEPISDWIAERFSQCDLLFRLPFHEPMEAFPRVQDVGLTGGTPRFTEAELRSLWRITTPPERTVLLTFGGLGLQQIPYEGLARFADWQFLTFDRQAPNLPNLTKVSGLRLRPVDLMPLCGCVVSKPGFSTFAEACRLDVPIITITRDDFAEAAVLIEGMQAISAHRVLTPGDFFAGTWDFLMEPLNSPLAPGTVYKAGNEDIAQAVVEYLCGFS